MSWRSEDPACMQDLLACSSFASQPVAAFLLSHSSTVKGVVRDMNSRMTPTESVIATFAGRSHPIEIKAWSLIHRVDMSAITCHVANASDMDTLRKAANKSFNALSVVLHTPHPNVRKTTPAVACAPAPTQPT
ncbi:unnamed protein product [Ixodes pacificus]